MSHEASNVLHEELSNDNVSDTCRVIALSRMISVFLEDADSKKGGKGIASSSKQSYKLLVPLMATGLKSAAALEVYDPEQSSLTDAKIWLLDHLWGTVFVSLARMFSPTPNGSKLLTIPHASDLIGLIHASADNVPQRHHAELCNILSSGASKCLDVAQQFSDTHQDDTETKAYRDDLLKLFAACFAGVCQLQPKDKNLRKIAEQALVATCDMVYAGQKADDDSNNNDLTLPVCLLICTAMQNATGIEHLVISVFPQLCQLVVLKTHVCAKPLEESWRQWTFIPCWKRIKRNEIKPRNVLVWPKQESRHSRRSWNKSKKKRKPWNDSLHCYENYLLDRLLSVKSQLY